MRRSYQLSAVGRQSKVTGNHGLHGRECATVPRLERWNETSGKLLSKRAR